MARGRGWRDGDGVYGPVSRVLHWGMALLFVWQFVTAFLHWLDDESPLTKALWDGHRVTGFLLLLLVCFRGAWGLANRHMRPVHPGRLGLAARAGHLALYLLMFLTPLVALVRSHVSGRGFDWLGIVVVPATGERHEALIAATNALHGPLGWLLLALVAGHATMALVHHFLFRDATLVRMALGRDRSLLAAPVPVGPADPEPPSAAAPPLEAVTEPDPERPGLDHPA